MARKRIAFLRTHLVKKKGVISSLINRSNLAVAEDTLRNNNNDREEVTQKGAQFYFFSFFVEYLITLRFALKSLPWYPEIQKFI